MSKEYVSGISVSDRQFQIGLFEVRDQKRLLLHSEVHDRDDASPVWFLRGLELSAKIFKHVSKISVALDSSTVIVHSFPVDTSLTQKEQQEHIHWEFSNIITDYKPEQYVVDIRVLKTHMREQTAEILAIAVQRQHIVDMQKLITGRGLNVGLIDTVYFGSEYTFFANYPEAKTKCVELVVMNGDRMDIGWYMNGRLISFISTSGSEPDKAIKKIQNRQTEFSIAEVFYCCPVNVIERLRLKHKASGIPMTVIDPFRRLVTTSMWRTSRPKDGSDYMLAACAGIALQSR